MQGTFGHCPGPVRIIGELKVYLSSQLAAAQLTIQPAHVNADHIPTSYQLRLMVRKSGDHQLRLVGYPIINRVLAPSKRWFSRQISGCHQQYCKFLEMPTLFFQLQYAI